MKKKLMIKGKLPKQRNPVAFALCTQGQFKSKVFRNRKKEVAKFDWRKEKDLGLKPRSFVLWGFSLAYLRKQVYHPTIRRFLCTLS